ncbi:GNAT family N-acetyltransferase [Facilibium subflavum]|uniref:GNAT family N-acetyltransferase n=1 Tax=Facilibium subflavum TaxID=2219058 RepID=UPI000E648DEF|nr:GNAT family N-acetyltransferase [Facilibium subflavum]
MKISVLNKSHQTAIQQLLADVNFFNADIFFSPEQRFFGFWHQQKLIGVIGVEIIDNYAIVRSLAVTPKYRGKGLAQLLLQQADAYLYYAGIKYVYAFTHYAANYLACYGYTQTLLERVPAEILAHRYTKSVITSEAIVMKKGPSHLKKPPTQQMNQPTISQRHPLAFAA